MGSPYRVCDLDLKGDWIPDLPNEEWQNKTASSSDGRFVGLVAWDNLNNHPGFRVYTIDTREESFIASDRIPGCCDDLEWKPAISQFTWLVF